MPTSLEELVEKAMTLPSESRAELADLLVQSLDSEGLSCIERMWVQ
jgi:hypothetical protein